LSPSFYCTLRTDPESVARVHWTRQWWAAYADACELATSAAVIDDPASHGRRSTLFGARNFLHALRV
jgi:hypothetical protein